MLCRHCSGLKKRSLSTSRSPTSAPWGVHLRYLGNITLIDFQGVPGPRSLLRLGKGSRATPREWDITLWITDKAGEREPGTTVALGKAGGGPQDASQLRGWAVCGRILGKFLSLC